jgi:hypothetical protein
MFMALTTLMDVASQLAELGQLYELGQEPVLIHVLDEQRKTRGGLPGLTFTLSNWMFVTQATLRVASSNSNELRCEALSSGTLRLW